VALGCLHPYSCFLLSAFWFSEGAALRGFNPPQSNSEDAKAKAENKAMLAISPKPAVSWLFPRVFAPLLFTSNCGDKTLILSDLRY